VEERSVERGRSVEQQRRMGNKGAPAGERRALDGAERSLSSSSSSSSSSFHSRFLTVSVRGSVSQQRVGVSAPSHSATQLQHEVPSCVYMAIK